MCFEVISIPIQFCLQCKKKTFYTIFEAFDKKVKLYKNESSRAFVFPVNNSSQFLFKPNKNSVFNGFIKYYWIFVFD